MRTRILAVSAGLMLAAAALAPAANAGITKPRVQPPSCNTTIANVVGGDQICEPTELQVD